MKCLALFAPALLILLIGCSDKSPIHPASEQIFFQSTEVLDAAAGEIDDDTSPGNQEQLLDQIEEAIAAGQVDTIYAKDYRVDEIPDNVPAGYVTKSAKIQLTEDSEWEEYNYVLPFSCGYAYIIYEWGRGYMYHKCL